MLKAVRFDEEDFGVQDCLHTASTAEECDASKAAQRCKAGLKKNLLLTEVIIASEIVDDFEYR